MITELIEYFITLPPISMAFVVCIIAMIILPGKLKELPLFVLIGSFIVSGAIPLATLGLAHYGIAREMWGWGLAAGTFLIILAARWQYFIKKYGWGFLSKRPFELLTVACLMALIYLGTTFAGEIALLRDIYRGTYIFIIVFGGLPFLVLMYDYLFIADGNYHVPSVNRAATAWHDDTTAYKPPQRKVDYSVRRKEAGEYEYGFMRDHVEYEATIQDNQGHYVTETADTMEESQRKAKVTYDLCRKLDGSAANEEDEGGECQSG